MNVKVAMELISNVMIKTSHEEKELIAKIIAGNKS
jgi:hypothetical protein